MGALQPGIPSPTAAAAKSLQLCPTLCDPIDGSPPGPSSLGFSRQEHWSGLPFPSPMRESEVTQLCPTLSDPMDCSLPGSSVRGIFQARALEWVPLPSPIIILLVCLFSFFLISLAVHLILSNCTKNQLWISLILSIKLSFSISVDFCFSSLSFL